MRRSARVASWVAATYHWNVVGIQGFRQHQGIRLMFMDLVDGYDLRCLLSPQVYEHVRRNASGAESSHIEKVVMTGGPEPRGRCPAWQSPSSATALWVWPRCTGWVSCTATSNRPISCCSDPSGAPKSWISDRPLRSANRRPPSFRPPLTQHRKRWPTDTHRASDLASLGYVLLELLAGKQIFHHDMTKAALMSAKRALPQQFAHCCPASWRTVGS